MVPGLGWFLLLSAFLFSTGAAGVMLRRNPLVVFMCVELMLNAGNLALVAFARFHHSMEGQVFALIVIAVAASEVVVGLALMVAIYKSGIEMDIDELSEMRG
jgi:NADH-quinone oxidoreductase subunit K